MSKELTAFAIILPSFRTISVSFTDYVLLLLMYYYCCYCYCCYYVLLYSASWHNATSALSQQLLVAYLLVFYRKHVESNAEGKGKCPVLVIAPLT